MKVLKIVAGILLTIAVLAIVAKYTSIEVRDADFTEEQTQNSPTPTPSSEFIPNPEHSLKYSAWMPSWASISGQESLAENASKFASISPVWFEVNTNGTLIDKRPANAAQIQAVAVQNDIDFIPAIAMFDHEIFSKVLQSEENKQRHITEIVEMVRTESYAGIDLDYESTKLIDKDSYFDFLKRLAESLDEYDKQLVVTVLAKWGEDITYPSLRETREVQDWTEIAKFADEVRIMAYDFTYIGSTYPGPIAPLDWVKEILDYAVTKLPREKIMLGIHLYSYEWFQIAKSKDSQNFPLFLPDGTNNPSSKSQARSYEYSIVAKLIKEQKGKIIDFQGEKIFNYQKTNPQTGKLENRVLVYIDHQGISSRVDLAKEYGIKGAVFWRLGNELDLLTVL